jgi:ribosomal protein L32
MPYRSKQARNQRRAALRASKVRDQYCAQCGESFRPQRATRRFCSTACRMATHRMKLSGRYPKAHQRKIREAKMLREPRRRVESLAGYSVETVSRATAAKIILHYEWLGNIGRSTIFVGLLSPSREVHGVACFGHGPGANVGQIIGEPALCLGRGACVHYAPPNAASFLINNACKLVHRLTGADSFFAYADPAAGEYGGVYQAAGWVYLGQGLDGKKGRSRRVMVLAPGKDSNRPEHWKTTREFRRAGLRMTFDEARAAGWQIAWREAKHVYAINVGRHRKKWRASIKCLPYPVPRPHLKRRPITARPRPQARPQPVPSGSAG